MRTLHTAVLLASLIIYSEARPGRRAITTVSVGLDGNPCPPTTTIELQPVFYSEYFPSDTVIVRNDQTIYVTNAPATITISDVLTRTIYPTTQQPAPTLPFTFGQGLPTSSYSSLPTDAFVFLAFTREPRQAKRDVYARQLTASASVSAATIVDLIPPQASGLLPPSECDNATPLDLINGSLSGGDFTLNKVFQSTAAILGSVTDSAATVINVTFSLNNGVLSWTTPDRGAASFYLCSGSIYASFENDAVGACQPISIGAIAGQVCVDFVARTRAVNPNFHAPRIATTINAGTSSVSTIQSSPMRSVSVQPAIPTTSISSNLAATTTIASSSVLQQPGIGSQATTTSSSISTVTVDTRPLSRMQSTPVEFNPSSGSTSMVAGSSAAPSLLTQSRSPENSLADFTPPNMLSSGIPSVVQQSPSRSPTLPASLSSIGSEPQESPSTHSTPGVITTIMMFSAPSVIMQPSTSQASYSALTQNNPAFSTTPGFEVIPASSLPSSIAGTQLTSQLGESLGSILSVSTSRVDLIPSLQTGTISVGGVLSTTSVRVNLPTSLTQLPIECQALDDLTGLSIAAQLAKCTISLGAISSINAGVASCLATTITTLSSGADFRLCLDLALGFLSPSTTFTAITTTHSTIPSITGLTDACQNLQGLTGILLQTQLALCRLSLGTFADDIDISNCLNNARSGSDIVQCLTAAIFSSPTSRTAAGTVKFSSPTVTSLRTTQRPSPTLLATLPIVCQTLDGLSGPDVIFQLEPCKASLGPLALSPSIAVCLDDPANGAELVRCLTDALLRLAQTSTTSSRQTSTMALPNADLPSACMALTGLTGLALTTQISLCATSLGNVASEPDVALCLNTLITASTTGSSIVDCLVNASLPVSSTSSMSKTTASSFFGNPTSISQLPQPCQALTDLTGLSVATQVNLCRASLGASAIDSNIAQCLATPVTMITIGSDIVLCLSNALLRASSTTGIIRTASSTATSTPILPQACQVLEDLSGLGVAPQLSLCIARLGDLVFRPDVARCINVVVGTGTLGSDIVLCLDAALSFAGSSAATTPARTTPSTAIPLPTGLTSACQALEGLDGFLIGPQLALCATSLDNLASQPEVANCINTALGVDTLGSDILTCLEGALVSRTTIMTTISTPTPLPNISAMLTTTCQQLSSLNGISVAPQLALCSASLGNSLSLPTVASCVSVNVDLNTSGADIVSCLTNAFASTSSTSRPLATSSVLPTGLPQILTPACQALVGLNGLQIGSQLALCTASLANLASLPDVASCLTAVNLNTIGANIAICLVDALIASPSTASRALSTTISLPAATGILTSACAALQDLNGFSVQPQVAFCATSLGTVAAVPRVASCLAVLVDINTSGSDISNCLIGALSAQSSTSSGTSAIPTITTSILTPSCQNLIGVNGLAVANQIILCATSLGNVALRTNVASCLAVVANVNTIGANVAACLETALTATTTPYTTQFSTVVPTALPTILPSACAAIGGVTAAQVPPQIMLCSTALGDLAQDPQIAICLASNVVVGSQGSDIVQCLSQALLALRQSTRSSVSTLTRPSITLPALSLPTISLPTLSLPTLSLPTLSLPTLSLPTLSLPTPSLPVLPAACESLYALTGLQLTSQLALCSADLGILASEPSVASCLSVTVNLSTDGEDIVNCLSNAFKLLGLTSSTSKTLTIPSTTLPVISTTNLGLPTPTSCLLSLPPACDALGGLVGLQITTQLSACSLALAPISAANPATLTCLATDIQFSTMGSDILQCLEAALLCPGQALSSVSTATRTSTTMSSPTSICISALPATCSALSSESGLGLVSGLSTCTLSLPLALRNSPSVALCLSTDVTNLVNGQSIVDCLSFSALCPGSASATRSKSTTGATSSPTPNCLTQIPASCNALGTLSGFALTLPFATCLLDITPLAVGQTLTSVTTCLNPASIAVNTQGSDVVRCLMAAAICPGSASSSGVASSTFTPTGIATPTSLPSCLNILPVACSSISGMGATALLGPVEACQLSLLPQLSLSAQAAAGACLSVGALLPTTTGTDITTCLSTSVLCESVTSSRTSTTLRTITRSSATLSSATLSSATLSSATQGPTPTAGITLLNCVTALRANCLSIASSNGLSLIIPLGRCQADLLPGLSVAATTKALTCLTATAASLGSERLSCLQNNLLCGGGSALPP